MKSFTCALSRPIRTFSRESLKGAVPKSSGTKIAGFDAKSLNQKLAKQALGEKTPILFLVGPAGSGKTFMACNHAIEELLNKSVEKIVVTRPTIGAGEDIGYLPGSLEDKMHPWVSPVMDIFHEELGKVRTEGLRKAGLLEICPLAFMRGRTFKNSVVILDEAQNTTPEQMMMALTRIGENSRVVVTGDPSQSDLSGRLSGLTDIMERVKRMNSLEFIRYVELNGMDIQRHAAVQELLTKVYTD
jgi:phosphate starvation-inducible PhoH-like protein